MQIDLNDFSPVPNIGAAFRMIATAAVIKLAEVGLDPATLMLWGPSLVLSSFAFSKIMNLISRMTRGISDHLTTTRLSRSAGFISLGRNVSNDGRKMNNPPASTHWNLKNFRREATQMFQLKPGAKRSLAPKRSLASLFVRAFLALGLIVSATPAFAAS